MYNIIGIKISTPPLQGK